MHAIKSLVLALALAGVAAPDPELVRDLARD